MITLKWETQKNEEIFLLNSVPLASIKLMGSMYYARAFNKTFPKPTKVLATAKRQVETYFKLKEGVYEK